MTESEHERPEGEPQRRVSRDELSTLLRAAFRGSGVWDTDALRTAVCAYVDSARERGEPVERVIIDLKQMMEIGGAWRRSATREMEMLAEGVIRWCIDRYYRAVDVGRLDDV